jgi:hypothetical protein
MVTNVIGKAFFPNSQLFTKLVSHAFSSLDEQRYGGPSEVSYRYSRCSVPSESELRISLMKYLLRQHTRGGLKSVGVEMVPKDKLDE